LAKDTFSFNNNKSIKKKKKSPH